MRTAVYRAYDADGLLLYVGVTSGLMQRIAQHEKSSEWAISTATITVEWWPTRAAALAAETRAIVTEGPVFNRSKVKRNAPNGVIEAEIIEEIEAFCVRVGMTPTMFGKRAMNDSALMTNLRSGRELRRSTAKRLRRFMADFPGIPSATEESAPARRGN